MKTILKTIPVLFFVFGSTMLQAQEEVEMADTLRSNGKIYVVVAIVSLVLVGVFAYLVRIDRKITGLENRLPPKKA